MELSEANIADLGKELGNKLDAAIKKDDFASWTSILEEVEILVFCAIYNAGFPPKKSYAGVDMFADHVKEKLRLMYGITAPKNKKHQRI